MPSPQTTSREVEELKEIIAEIHDLQCIQGLIGWDLETMMPKKASGIRANQMATLTRLVHQRMTSPQLMQLLEAAGEQVKRGEVEPLSGVMVREFKRDFERSSKIPADLMETFVHLTTEAHHLWIEARTKKQFSIFQPILEKIVDVNRKIADVVGYQGSPYNALLDEYEPGLTVEQIDPLFATLKPSLVTLLKKIQAKKSEAPDFLKQSFSTDKQLAFSRYILEEMAFDFDAGRLDLSAHPFTSGTGYADVRLTTRIDESDLFSALSSSMHEGGHGLYEQNVDPDLWRLSLGGGSTLGIHESQSRLWENLIGRSLPFWKAYFPKLQAQFKPQLDNVTLEQMYKANNQVQPSFIRVEADEVTYNLHILIRYEIEKALIEETLQVKDIPGAWNGKYQEYLGITPSDDAQGCLQDVHWSHGSFGYFPTYTLGNLYSAQFYRQAKLDIPTLEEKIASGDLKTLTQWLKEKIHFSGKSETAAEIVQRVCGETLNSRYFVEYLEEKYNPLYGL